MVDLTRDLWLVTEQGEIYKSRCFHNRAWPEDEWCAQFDDDYAEHHKLGVDVFETELDAVTHAIKNIDAYVEELGDRRAELADRLFELLCGEPLTPSWKERRKARRDAAQSSKYFSAHSK